MQRALVLDFGGVVTRTLFETHDATEDALGLSRGTLTWRGPFDPNSDALWQQMLNGDISERDYYALRTSQVSELIGADWQQMSEFVRAARGADPAAVIRPEALAAIEQAKADGHKLAILSNELDLFYGPQFRQQLSFMNDIDTIVDATYTKILKPDRRAYAECCMQLAMTAGDCVFVDDQIPNVKGATEYGMIAVAFDVRKPREGFANALTLLNQ